MVAAWEGHTDVVMELVKEEEANLDQKNEVC